MAQRRRKLRRISDLVVAVLFFAALWVPVAGVYLGWGQGMRLNENRRLATMPPLSLDPYDAIAWFARFRAYFRDHFAFRPQLIRVHSLIKVQWLHVSPDPRGVIIGKNGWLFFAAEGSIDAYTRSDPFTPRELEQWASTIEQQGRWLARRGVKYVFVIAPAKGTIYPDFLPDYLRRLEAPSRLDQLAGRLENSPDVTFIDLRSSLTEAREHERVYHMTDTHWNQRGAYAAYRQILQAGAFPGQRPLERTEFIESAKLTSGGDLAALIGLEDVLLEQELRLLPRIEPPWEGDSCRLGPHPDGTDRPRVVVLGDSFMRSLLPLLMEHIGGGVCLMGSEFDRPVIEREMPDLVLQEITERRLHSLKPLELPEPPDPDRAESVRR